MRLFLLGATRPNQWKVDIAEAGELLGWDVTHHPDRGVPCEDVVRAAKGHDLFLWARTHGKEPAGNVRNMINQIKKMRIPTAGLHLDLYFGLRRTAQVGRDPWWSHDFMFTADGGHQAQFTKRGVNHFWLPPAMSFRYFGRGNVRKKFSHKIAFVGNNSMALHGRHRSELVRWASRTWGKQFVRYSPPRNGVYCHDLNDLYASVQVAIGDSSPSAFYWSDRVPTTLGRGGMLAYPYTDGLEQMGFNEENMILYDRFDFKNLKEQIDSLTTQQRRDKTEAALALIWDRHMWTHRLKQIQHTVFG